MRLIHRYSKPDLSIVVGSEDGHNGTTYAIKKIVVHPKYEHEFDYDFSLLKIKGKFSWSDKVKAISLPKTEPTANTSMVVAGWGFTVRPMS